MIAQLPIIGVNWAGTPLDPINDPHIDTRFPAVAIAREFVRASAPDKGCNCPCCGQYAKLYRRSLTSAMALALVQIYHYFRQHHWKGWLHVPEHLAAQKSVPPRIAAGWHGGDWSKLRYWQLIEPQPGERQDGSPRMGYWAITELGRQFVEREMKVPKYFYIYAQTFMGLDLPYITIDEALGTTFNYDQLMGNAT